MPTKKNNDCSAEYRKGKSNRVSRWKHRGMVSDDWEATHELFMSTVHCDLCSVFLTKGNPMTRTTKCLDHDHSIYDRENVRAVLCHACNMIDRCDNTSGVPNVCYHTSSKCWKYQKVTNGVLHQKYFKDKADAIRYKYHFESCQRIIAEDANG